MLRLKAWRKRPGVPKPANHATIAAGIPPGGPATAGFGFVPRVRQTFLNLKIWLPVLQNPRDRERMVTYSPRENREGM